VKKDVPGLSLRLAGPEDAAVINAMIADFASFERLPNHSTVAALQGELSRPDRILQVVIAELDGKAVGMSAFFETYSTFAAVRGLYLEDIFVREDFRNRGIATAILSFIAKHAVSRDLARVEFNVLLWNNVAIEFFETQGATPNSAWTTYRLSGEWLHRLARDASGAQRTLP